MSSNKDVIAVIGLGYVGLPLAVELAKKYEVIGYDINTNRIIELQNGFDHTLEVEETDLQKVLVKEINQTGLYVSNETLDIANANIYIVTVPTPTDQFNRPFLKPLEMASTLVGDYIKKGDIVIV